MSVAEPGGDAPRRVITQASRFMATDTTNAPLKHDIVPTARPHLLDETVARFTCSKWRIITSKKRSL
jgi:hypothetical protein